MKPKVLDTILALALFVVVISGFSYTWSPMSSTSFVGGISVSADGRIVCVCPSTTGRLRLSRDGGQTWSIATNAPAGGNGPENPVAFSANGSQMVACLSSNFGSPTWVFLSTDFGTNWTKLGLPTLSFGAYCVASSAAGSNLIAAADTGPVYFSTNSGASWSTASVPPTNLVSLASSADGRRIVGAGDGTIYVSTNFGADWTSANLPTPEGPWVCISADGKSIGVSGANTYISRNEGSSWITNKIKGSIACSADGMTWMVAGAQVYTSNDGGLTWSTNFASAKWEGAMSADGCEIVVCQLSGSGLTNWVGHITPSPHLNIETISGNLGISWLLPSTNFVLQQTADLSNSSWTGVSSNPTLNFTNLQQQVSVPATGSNAFFRLVAQ